MILKNHASTRVRKERLSSSIKARRASIRNRLVEKTGEADKVKTFREINSSKDCTRAPLGYGMVNPFEMGREI